MLSADKVGDLREQLKLKLISKKELEADSEIAVKDNDDFELASDDELKDVLPDCKVRVYLKAKASSPVAVPAVVAAASAPVVVVPAVN